MTGNWLLVRSARQLLTLRGARGPRRGSALRELAIVKDGALLICDGAIVDAGPTRRIENLKEARAARSIDALGRVVMPALIDSELQLISPSPRAGAFPEKSVFDRYAGTRRPSTRSSGRLAAEMRLVADRLVRHGTGRAEVLVGPGWDEAGVVRALRVLQTAGPQLPLAVTPTLLAMPGNSAGALDHDLFAEQFCNGLLPLVARRKLVRFVAIAAGPRYLNGAQCRRILDACLALQVGVKVLCDPREPSEGIRLGAENGITSISDFGYPHALQLREVAAAKCVLVLTCEPWEEPGGERQEKLRALVDQGAAIALATAFHPLEAGSYSMQHALRTAVHGMRLDPAEAVSAATINAACNHGKGAECGSLEPGKRADFIILNMNDYRELFARPGVNALHLMARAGKIVYREADVVWR